MICTKGNGRIKDGRYSEKENGHAAIEGVAWKESMILNPDKQEYGDKKAEIIDFGIFDATGKITNTVSKFEECVLKLKVQFHEDVLNPILHLQSGI